MNPKDAAESELSEETRPAEWRRIVLLESRVARLEQQREDLYYGYREQARDAAAEDLRARVKRLEQLLLTALVALERHEMFGASIAHGTRSQDVSGAVERLGEAIGKEQGR